MTAAEIVRRLRALVAMEPKKRPVTIDRLERVAGVSDNTVYDICRNGTMQEKTRARMERALTLVENDQLVVKPRSGTAALFRTKSSESVRAPQPPQVNVKRVVFTENGPKIQIRPVNPLSFPVLDAPTIKAKNPSHGR